MANPHASIRKYIDSFMADFPANHVSFRGGVLELGFFGDDLRLHMRMAVLEGFG